MGGLPLQFGSLPNNSTCFSNVQSIIKKEVLLSVCEPTLLYSGGVYDPAVGG